MSRTRVISAVLMASAVVLLGCPTDPFSGSGSNGNNNNGSNDPGLTVTSGSFSWAVTAQVPLRGNGGPMSCTATASGTTTVGGDGTFSIAFPALACSGCTMTASTSGTVTSKTVTGTMSATIAGTSCSGQQPTPSPTTLNGTCSTTSCSVSNPSEQSFAVTYTLTPG